MTRTVHVDPAGNVVVKHGADDPVLDALSDIGPAGATAQASVQFPEPLPEPAHLKESNKRFVAACQKQNQAYQRLQTATQIAAALIQKGQTRRRNPDYIADKSADIAAALHARHPDALQQVSWQDINDAVLAEMNDDATQQNPGQTI